MPTNPFFNNTHASNEQRLLEDLFVEAIKIKGTDAFYLIRNDQQTDLVYGEDPTKSFTSAYPIEVYNENVTEYEGQKEIFSRFGLEIHNDYTVYISRKTFRQRIKSDPKYDRPREGDLIFIPHVSLDGTLFEITWVEPDKDFFMAGRRYPYYYQIKLEPFKYSDEVIQTGMEDIDSTAFEEAYTIKLIMGSGSGNYEHNEYIFQGSNLATSNASAIVSEWNRPNKYIEVSHIKGTFKNNVSVKGATSNANYVLTTYDNLDNNLDRVFDNEVIRSEGTGYINFDENNPFGEV